MINCVRTMVRGMLGIICVIRLCGEYVWCSCSSWRMRASRCCTRDSSSWIRSTNLAFSCWRSLGYCFSLMTSLITSSMPTTCTALLFPTLTLADSGNGLFTISETTLELNFVDENWLAKDWWFGTLHAFLLDYLKVETAFITMSLLACSPMLPRVHIQMWIVSI